MNIDGASSVTGDRRSIRRLGGLSGMTASALFVIVFSVEGFLRPGYDWASEFISALSHGPRGWIQIASFVVTGALLFSFARSLAAEFGRTARIGVTLQALIALCLLLSGPFVMDPMGIPWEQMSLRGKIHQVLGAAAFTLMAAGCFIFAARFGRDPKWRPLRVWSLLAGFVIVAAIVFLKAATLPGESSNPLAAWAGLIQRAVVTAYLVWVFAVGLTLSRSAKRSTCVHSPTH